MKKEKNYFLEKKHFYVSELHMGIDGLESVSDYHGPYNTLKTAQNAFKKYVINDKFLNNWDYAIRGPKHTPKRILPHITPTDTIWYSDGVSMHRKTYVEEDLQQDVDNPDFEHYAGRYGKSVKEWKEKKL